MNKGFVLLLKNDYSANNYNYYYEHQFPNVIQQRFNHMMTQNTFSLCHINIRSQKANLKPFEICLENLEFQFSVIGITETWLKDFNSDLYNIDGFNFVETHRTEKTWGGVGIFLKSNLCYQRRSDLTVDHELFESIFCRNR